MKENQLPELYKIEEQPALPEQAEGRQLQYLEVRRRELSGSKQKVQKPCGNRLVTLAWQALLAW